MLTSDLTLWFLCNSATSCKRGKVAPLHLKNVVIPRRCFAEDDDKEMYQNLYLARTELAFCLLNLLFSDILFAVVVVVAKVLITYLL